MKYWYFIYIQECPLCGFSRETRERRYDEKPVDWNKRHEFAYIAYHCGY